MKRICPLHGYYTIKSKKDRCPKCNRQSNKTYDKTKRDKGQKKIYNNKKWTEESRPAAMLRDGMKCVKCGSKENLIVDHIVELQDGGDAYALDNLQTLCKKCHAIKTEDEKRSRNGR